MKKVTIILDNEMMVDLEDYFKKESMKLEFEVVDDWDDEEGMKEIVFNCKDYMVDFILRHILGLGNEDIEEYLNNGINVVGF